MLKDHETSFVVGTQHPGVKTISVNTASIFTANVDKYRSRAVPVLVTDPVTLFVRGAIKEVEMIDQVRECRLRELS